MRLDEVRGGGWRGVVAAVRQQYDDWREDDESLLRFLAAELLDTAAGAAQGIERRLNRAAYLVSPRTPDQHPDHARLLPQCVWCGAGTAWPLVTVGCGFPEEQRLVPVNVGRPDPWPVAQLAFAACPDHCRDVQDVLVEHFGAATGYLPVQ